MSTTPTVPAATASFNWGELIIILETALSVAAGIVGGPVGGDLVLANALIQIAQKSATALKAQAGQPIDLSKIPQEPLVP